MDRTLSDRIFPPVLLLLALAWLLPWMPAHAEAPAEWVALPLSGGWWMPPTRWEARRQRLVEKLEALERRRGAQIAVVMLPTTGTLDIEAFSDKLFQAWKLGRKAVDDGLLLVVAGMTGACASRSATAWRGAVPDVVAGRIIRERMAPAFREGDYAGGIEAAVDELIRLVDGETLPAAASSCAESLAGAIAGGSLGAAGRLHLRIVGRSAVECPRCAGPGCSAGRCSAGCWHAGRRFRRMDERAAGRPLCMRRRDLRRAAVDGAPGLLPGDRRTGL